MKSIGRFFLASLVAFASLVAEPVLRAFRLAMRHATPKSPSLPKLIKFAQHAWQKRGYGKALAGGSGGALALPGVAAALAVMLVVAVLSAHGLPDGGAGLMMFGGITATEQVKDLETTLTAKVTQLTAINDKVSKEGRTKDEAEREEFNTLSAEIDALTAELQDAKRVEGLMQARAKPVDGAPNGVAASTARDPHVVVKHPEKLAPGIEMSRHVMCLAAAKGDVPRALALAKTHYPQQVRSINVLEASIKAGTEPHKLIGNLVQMQAANVPAGTTTHETWAEPLVEYNTFAGDFLEYLRPRTILGQLTGLRRIPFNVHIKGRTSGGTAGWTGEGKAKPVTKFDYIDAYHGFTKLAAISVLTEELIRFSNPSAEANVREALSETIIAKMDNDFVDPDIYHIDGVRPASITRGVASILSSGDDADAVRADLQQLWGSALATNLPLTSAVYITTPAIALSLSLMTNPLGQPEFADLNMNGGTLRGVKVVVSNYIPTGLFILAFESEIYLSDDGVVTVDASREASIEMSDEPASNSGTPTGASLVSMFQTNSVALRAERFVNWSKRRANAVAVLRNVGWGGAIES